MKVEQVENRKGLCTLSLSEQISISEHVYVLMFYQFLNNVYLEFCIANANVITESSVLANP